tara:strand:- start:227 stop:604 length:378 start_codon:yes stop_codon:yes gene_type:complete
MVGPYMTTTRYNRKQKPTKNKKVLAAQAEHAAWLKKMGVDDDSLEKRAVKNKNGRKEGINNIPDYKDIKSTVALSNKVAAHGPAVAKKEYSGERKLIGIATMHKSNMVPVFAEQDAIDIAQMRRN